VNNFLFALEMSNFCFIKLQESLQQKKIIYSDCDTHNVKCMYLSYEQIALCKKKILRQEEMIKIF
jgi:hypothetical protein